MVGAVVCIRRKSRSGEFAGTNRDKGRGHLWDRRFFKERKRQDQIRRLKLLSDYSVASIKSWGLFLCKVGMQIIRRSQHTFKWTWSRGLMGLGSCSKPKKDVQIQGSPVLDVWLRNVAGHGQERARVAASSHLSLSLSLILCLCSKFPIYSGSPAFVGYARRR